MKIDHRRPDLSIDQQIALKTAATHLAREFDGPVGTETIERFLHSSYDEFAGRAAVLNHLPLLAERLARQRLRALAEVEGDHDTGVPVVLFLCTHNAGRSQMAPGFFQHLAGDHAVALVRRLEPHRAGRRRRRHGHARARHRHLRRAPELLTTDAVQASGVVVTMGCGDAYPVHPGKRYLDWQLTDLAGKGVDAVRSIRAEIDTRVRGLLDELGVAPASGSLR